MTDLLRKVPVFRVLQLKRLTQDWVERLAEPVQGAAVLGSGEGGHVHKSHS